ncbi:MAG: LptM family lipoprotein [Mobilitalea sp.]
MKKSLLFMLVSLMLFTLVGCGGSTVKEDETTVDTEINVENDEKVTEEQMRIDENNAVIQPKLDEFEATIVEIETALADNNLSDKYQSYIDEMREEFDRLTKNHQIIIDMGGYLEGTADFEAAVDEVIELYKEILAVINDEIESMAKSNEFVDKYNELIDLVNEVTVNAQENGWSENEEILSELGAVYGLLDEVGEKIASSDVMEETYRNEKVEIIDQLFPVFQNHLETVSVPFAENDSKKKKFRN